MFRMYGRIVEILKYQVSYTKNEEDIIQYTVSEEEANEIAQHFNGTVTQLELSDDAWMDGIEVDDVPNTRGAALEIYQMGEEDYNKLKAKPSEEQRIEALESAMLSMMGVNADV